VELAGLYGYTNKDWRYSLPENAADKTALAAWQMIPQDKASSHATQLASLLDSMDLNERPLSGTVDIRPTLECITALYKSSATGSTVRSGSIGPGDPFYLHVAGHSQ
jgi:hypothetical protein